jgi:hypothetical protein
MNIAVRLVSAALGTGTTVAASAGAAHATPDTACMRAGTKRLQGAGLPCW